MNETESKIRVNYDHLDDKLMTQASKTLKLGQGAFGEVFLGFD